MDSSSTLTTHHLHPKPPQKQLQPPSLPPRPSRRTSSFSSSSSTASFSPYNSSSSSLESLLYFPRDDNDHNHPSNPYSPMGISGGRGVPFSWEHLPGIPKKQTCYNKINNINHLQPHHQESSMKLLPLPPPTNNNIRSSYNYKKKNSLHVFQKDPFFAAMVECSKGDIGDDHHQHDGRGRGREGGLSSNNNNKVTRSMSDRLGFVNFYSSCKNASAISESIVYLPTSRRSSRTNYHHLNRRRSL